ncbi:MAG: OmpA family protein [Polyangiaceae bacterium]|nr:OmpA family protein [Polyangiaceae bacterium]
MSHPTLQKRGLWLALVGFGLWACLFTLGREARADVDGRLGLELRGVAAGDDLPALVLRPSENVKRLRVKLTRGDGQALALGADGLAAGSEKVLSIQQPNGRFAWQARFEVRWGDDSDSSFDFSFETTRVGKLKLLIAPENVDLDARSMTFRMSNPADRAELAIVGKEGQTLKLLTQSYGGAAEGTTLALGWAPLGADILYLDLKVYDIAGFWTGVRLTPFSIEIPHDDVTFDNGKWDIRPSEEPKLERTMTLVREALAKHGTLLQLKLFIAGYTDTVGSKASNQTLSENRARAIAGWFAKKGLKAPILYQGFGEDALAVDTPDETPEPRNRRALYLLSSQLPGTSRHAPRADWKKL